MDASGNLYFADDIRHQIIRISNVGIASVFAGTGSTFPFRGGFRTTATFDGPNDIAIDANGNMYVVETFQARIRKISSSGQTSILAGGSFGFQDGFQGNAQFRYPTGICVGPEGNIYVADHINATIRKITPAGMVSTVAGIPELRAYEDGEVSVAKFNNPVDVVVDAQGNIYVADGHKIRKVAFE